MNTSAPDTGTGTPSVTAERPAFATADIPALRRALLADAEAHYERHRRFYRADEEPLVGDQSGNPYLAAWSALAVASSQAQIIAALLGIAQRDPGLTDAGRAEMTRLVGQVLDGWREVLEGANDDLPAAPEPQIPGQQEIPAPRGFKVGDLVEIIGRGVHYDGKTGVITGLDEDADGEYPISLDVEGFAGPVWCNPGEIRHLSAEEIAQLESGAAR